MRRILPILLILLLATAADAQTRAPRKKKKARRTSEVYAGTPVAIPDLLISTDSAWVSQGEPIPNYARQTWTDGAIGATFRLDEESRGGKVSGTILFDKDPWPLLVLEMVFHGANGGELGRIYLPVASGSGRMAEFCRVVDPTIQNPYAVAIERYTAASPVPVATLDELLAIRERMNVSTACRLKNDPSVYVIGADNSTIYAVPTAIWHDPKSPFYEMVILPFECD